MSLRTRALLLDAALDSLADVGYGNSSIRDIAARAGVTRGAQAHHFHTRAELFAQTIDHLAIRQRESIQERLQSMSASIAPADVLIDLISATFAGKLGKASIELYGSIVNDEDQRRTMLRVQHGVTVELLEICAGLIGPEIARDRLESTFWMTINMMRGTTVDEMLGRDEARRKQVVADWRQLAAIALGAAL